MIREWTTYDSLSIGDAILMTFPKSSVIQIVLKKNKKAGFVTLLTGHKFKHELNFSFSKTSERDWMLICTELDVEHIKIFRM